MVNTENILVVGRFGSPHGIKGWIKLYSFTDPIDNIVAYHPLKIKRGDQLETVTLAESRVRSKDVVVRIEQCDNREAAAEYTNLELVVDKTQLPKLEEDEFYWHELVGLTVTNRQAETLGEVKELMETGSHDVLVVSQAGKPDILIPYVLEHFIDKIDLTARTMIVDWELDG